MAFIRRSAVGIVMAAAVASIGLVGTGPAQADPCGYYTTSTNGYYRHCGNSKVAVIVERYSHNGTYYKDVCLAPGTHWLGHSVEDTHREGSVIYASSNGDPC